MMSTKTKIDEIKQVFPTLSRTFNGRPYCYLDNSATTLKPQRVIDAITDFYTHSYATVHRGVYALSQEATDRFDGVRETVKQYINAASSNEIVFTRGATEAINLVAYSYGRTFINEGDDVIVTQLEHHANLIPWQVVCEEKKANLRYIPITEKGELDLEAFRIMLSGRTKFVALNHVSNALGTINDIAEVISLAHDMGAKVLVDGAQAAGHLPVDVQALDIDFYTMSSHKLFGPTGAGALYGKFHLLENMPPYQTGGAMIEQVTLEKTRYAQPPMRFEAGTPAIAEVIGFGEALNFIQEIGLDTIAEHEDRLLKEATEKLKAIPGIRIIGEADHKASVLSFLIENIHPHDAGTIFDELGIAVRVGHHCAQPIMNFYRIPATIRASFSIYNTSEDVDTLIDGIKHVRTVMGEA